MILIITSKRDGHIGAVSRYLDAAGTPWVRLNTEDFANVELTVSPANGRGTLFVRDSGRKIEIQEVEAVWFRKPEPVDISRFTGLERGALDYIEAEFGETLLGLYSLLNHVPGIAGISGPLSGIGVLVEVR